MPDEPPAPQVYAWDAMRSSAFRALFPWIGAAWLLVCIGAFLWNRPIPFGTDRIPPLPSPEILTQHFLLRALGHCLRVALFWMASWRLGGWLLQPFRIAGLTRTERTLTELGLGAGALGLAAFSLGIVGLLNGQLLIGVLAALSLASLPGLISTMLGVDLRTLGASAYRNVDKDRALPLLFIAAAALYQFLVALGPTVFYDSLTYHLALPDLYLRQGALVATPMNVYAGIPQGVEMLYLWLLPLGGLGTTSQLLHLTLGLLTVAVIACLGKRMGHAVAGVWGAAIFLLNPMVLLESGRPAVELGWSFYLALTLLALNTYKDLQDKRGLVLVGILAGLTLGTKYQAVILLAAITAHFWDRLGWRQGWRPAALVCAVAVALAAPWGLRNIAFYQNPIFPFTGGVFRPSEFVDLAAFTSSAHGRDWAGILRGGEPLWRFLMHPWSYAMPYETSEADNVMSLAYLAVLPLFIFLRPSGFTRSLLVFSAVLWLPMNLLSGLARFSIPALVPLSLAAAMPLQSFPRGLALARNAAAAVILGLSLLYVHSKTDALLWRVLNGSIEEKTFLSHRRPIYPVPPFAAFTWANDHLPAEAKILLVGEPRSFYLERRSETSSPYADQPIAVYANDSSSGEDLYQKLKTAGITHIYLNVAGMSLSRQTMRMSAEGLAALRDFWRQSLVAVFVDSSKDPKDPRFSVVYRILTEDEVRRPHPPVEVPFGAQEPAGS